ncbi:MAG: zinc ribbon domain-containing protein [Anaerolineaceae bacterium]
MDTHERYVDKFYNYLAEGKLMGQKCDDCGTYTLFPVPVCNNCKGTHMSWTELSGEAKLLFISVSKFPAARFAKFAPCGFGSIQLKEGPVFFGIVDGIDVKDPVNDYNRLPIDVDIVIREIAGNHVPTAKVR